MKKVLLFIVVIAIIAVILVQLSKKSSPQPALADIITSVSKTPANSKIAGLLDLSGLIQVQPLSEEQANAKHKAWCKTNGDGTITIGIATWVKDFLFFGHWDYTPGKVVTVVKNASLVPAGDLSAAEQMACDAFLQSPAGNTK